MLSCQVVCMPAPNHKLIKTLYVQWDVMPKLHDLVLSLAKEATLIQKHFVLNGPSCAEPGIWPLLIWLESCWLDSVLYGCV